jgi:hypothetical protein
MAVGSHFSETEIFEKIYSQFQNMQQRIGNIVKVIRLLSRQFGLLNKRITQITALTGYSNFPNARKIGIALKTLAFFEFRK